MGTEYDHIFLPIGSVEVITHNLGPRLGSGELLTGTPVITDVTDAGVATGELTIDDETLLAADDSDSGYLASEAVQFSITTSETDSAKYLLKISCNKDTDVTQTVVDYLWVHFDYPCDH